MALFIYPESQFRQVSNHLNRLICKSNELQLRLRNEKSRSVKTREFSRTSKVSNEMTDESVEIERNLERDSGNGKWGRSHCHAAAAAVR